MSALQPSLNLGLNESDFWNMTIAEVQRWLEGATWRLKMKAQFDYQLANLIGLSSGRLLDSKITFPDITEVYPHLFEEERKLENERENQIKKSQNNFMALAMRINQQYEARNGDK